ncbi:MAG: hypothetical protein HC893_01240 [Chloroflexaceae bacterium]|nr:hypothetical protein [Chloroflexaceae bacterium]
MMVERLRGDYARVKIAPLALGSSLVFLRRDGDDWRVLSEVSGTERDMGDLRNAGVPEDMFADIAVSSQ